MTPPELPEALTGHAGYLGVVMGQRSQERFEVAMATLDLRPVHYDFLASLGENGPLAQKDLARLLEVDAARIVALTDELQARGLVDRSVDARDRRRNLVSLTRAGRTLTAKAQRLSSAVEEDLLARLSAAERAELRALLRKALDL
jgi:DNA-binding MarR family transcriptional regulator